MGEHAVEADAVEVSRGIARMRNVDHVLRQQTRPIIARLPLVDNGPDSSPTDRNRRRVPSRRCVAQFVQQDLQDLQDFREGLVAKDTPVSTLLHQRQRVADRQLVTRQGAVGLTRPNIGDDGVDGVQIALVGRDLD
jgi:hypothetical protein